MLFTLISIYFFIVCGAVRLKDENTKALPQEEDILSNLDIPDLGNKDDRIVPALHWTKESLLNRRESFTKEDIDKAYIDDLNVELLLEGMTVGKKERYFKPIGLRPDETPRAVSESVQLSSGDREIKSVSSHRQKRTFIPKYEKMENYWINSTVPYFLEENTFQDLVRAKTMIREIMDYVESLTCARFIEISPSEASKMISLENYDFIKIIGSGRPSCGTFLGRFSAYYDYTNTIHYILLNEMIGCVNRGTIGHELGHVLGMNHEFTRSDRDEHMTVHFDRIKPTLARQFTKSNTVNRTPFDYGSLLQYPSFGGYINYQEKTLEARDPELEYLLRASYYLSYYDIMAINKAYQCFDNCSTKKCEYGAVRDETCTCLCPSGLQGPTCGEVVNSNTCGGIINITPGKETIVKSPKFNTLPRNGSICHWLLKAPKEYSITIKVDDFYMSWNEETNRCYHWLEINYNLIGQPAPKVCGDSFPRSKVSTSKYGETNLMMLKWDTKTVSGAEQKGGFKLRANAYRVYGIKSKGCPKPPKIMNTVNNYKTVGRKNGAIVSYKCTYPYTMFGDVASITCQADNTWSNSAFTCELKEPVLACDFEKDDCNFTQKLLTPYRWKRTVMEGNAFYRIDTAVNTMGVVSHYFSINAGLEKYRKYCLSVSLRRPNGIQSCAVYTISFLTKEGLVKRLMRSTECYDTNWTTYRTSFSATETPSIFFFTETSLNQLFNLDFDNISIREGGC